MLCLWLGRFILCDNRDTFHQRVIPLALAVARGHVLPLPPMFLGLLYHELDEIHNLEEQVTGSASNDSCVLELLVGLHLGMLQDSILVLQC